MWYTTTVGPYVTNTERELAVHMSRPGSEHQIVLGRFIGYLKVKETKFVTIRNTKVLREVMFCDSNYAINKETIKISRGVVATLI